MSGKSISEREIDLRRARESSEVLGVRIIPDKDLREYANGDMDRYTAIRFEEMHSLLMEAGLLTEDEYRTGPNYETLTACANRILAARAKTAN